MHLKNNILLNYMVYLNQMMKYGKWQEVQVILGKNHIIIIKYKI